MREGTRDWQKDEKVLPLFGGTSDSGKKVRQDSTAHSRKYSYSDRARYYIGQPEVVAAMNKLFDNLREYPIPMNMLHQYMPISYAKIREGQLKLDPRELAMDGIVQFMLDYESAV